MPPKKAKGNGEQSSKSAPKVKRGITNDELARAVDEARDQYNFHHVERRQYNQNLNNHGRLGYLRFAREYRSQPGQDYENVKGHLVYRAWKALSDEERSAFCDDAADEIAKKEGPKKGKRKGGEDGEEEESSEESDGNRREEPRDDPKKKASKPTGGVGDPDVGSDGDGSDDSDSSDSGTKDKGNDKGDRKRQQRSKKPEKSDKPDPKTYIWNREEWKKWTNLPRRERLPYLQYALSMVEVGNSGGEVLIDGWSDLTMQDMRDLFSDGTIQDWGLYDDLEDTEEDFQFEERRESTVSISSSANLGGWVPESTEQNLIIRETSNEFAGRAQGTWKFVRVLYRRRNQEGLEVFFRSSNCLYVCFDDEDVSRDRIVVKHMEWASPEDRQIQLDACVCFSRLPAHKSIMPQLGYRIATHQTLTRTLHSLITYTNYCPAESLEKVVEKYSEIVRNNDPFDQIPEPFIWVVFLSIAEALYFLETGLEYEEDTQPGDKDPNWTPILHRDLKTPNIFLDESQPPYSEYPHPLLADFDLSCELKDEKFYERSQGTFGWQAPETVYHEDINEIDKPPLSPKSDIFVLGLIIWELIHSSLGFGRLRRIREGNEGLREDVPFNFIGRLEESTGSAFPDEPEDWIAAYSRNLIHLTYTCLSLDPEARPSAYALVKRIREEIKRIESVVGKFSNGMIAEHLRLRGAQEDQFPLNKKYKKRKLPSWDDNDEESHGDDVETHHPSHGKRRKSTE